MSNWRKADMYKAINTEADGKDSSWFYDINVNNLKPYAVLRAHKPGFPYIVSCLGCAGPSLYRGWKSYSLDIIEDGCYKCLICNLVFTCTRTLKGVKAYF